MSNREKPILACYLPIGDPAIGFDQVALYAECGVDVFEVGIPTNNPFMDGKIVKDSMRRTLETGLSQADIGSKLIEIKKNYAQKYIVVMGYENMQLSELKVNDCDAFDAVLRVGSSKLETDVEQVCFVPYAMSDSDIEQARQARCYLMLQAASGTTGLRQTIDEANRKKIECLKQAGIKIPILLGFGISNADQAASAIRMGANGVIIGSACLFYAEQGETALRQFLGGVREAIDAVRC